MILVNIGNIERIIFNNAKVRQKLPEFRGHFDQWQLACQHSFLKSLGKQAMIDVLNMLNERHLKIIEEELQEEIHLDKINNRMIENYSLPLESAENALNELENLSSNFCIYKNNNNLYISFWR